jgi:hypothetical protein
MIHCLHFCHWTPTAKVICPSIESSVRISVAEVTVLVNRICELRLRGSAAPQGEKIVDVNGIVSDIS